MAGWWQGSKPVAALIAGLATGLAMGDATMAIGAPARPASALAGHVASLARGFVAAADPAAYVRANATVTDRAFEASGSVGIAIAGSFGEGSQLHVHAGGEGDRTYQLELVPLAHVGITLDDLTAVFGPAARNPVRRNRIWHYRMTGPKPAAAGYLSRVLVTLSSDPKLPTSRVKRIQITYERG